MGTYVEGQTTISVFVIKMSSKFWWPSSVILIPSLILPYESCKRVLQRNTPAMSPLRRQKEIISLFESK